MSTINAIGLCNRSEPQTVNTLKLKKYTHIQPARVVFHKREIPAMAKLSPAGNFEEKNSM